MVDVIIVGFIFLRSYILEHIILFYEIMILSKCLFTCVTKTASTCSHLKIGWNFAMKQLFPST